MLTHYFVDVRCMLPSLTSMMRVLSCDFVDVSQLFSVLFAVAEKVQESKIDAAVKVIKM